MKSAWSSVCLNVLAAIIIRLQKSYQGVSLILRSLQVEAVWEGGTWDCIWRWIMGKYLNPSRPRPSSKMDFFFLRIKRSEIMMTQKCLHPRAHGPLHCSFQQKECSVQVCINFAPSAYQGPASRQNLHCLRQGNKVASQTLNQSAQALNLRLAY